MSLKSNKGQITVTQSLKPAARTASANGTAVDTKGANSVKVYFDVGTWTDGSHTFSLEECDTSGGTYSAIASDNIDGTLTACTSAATDDTVQVVGLKGKCKRYVRAIVTVSGATTGAIYGAFVELDNINKV